MRYFYCINGWPEFCTDEQQTRNALCDRKKAAWGSDWFKSNEGRKWVMLTTVETIKHKDGKREWRFACGNAIQRYPIKMALDRFGPVITKRLKK